MTWLPGHDVTTVYPSSMVLQLAGGKDGNTIRSLADAWLDCLSHFCLHRFAEDMILFSFSMFFPSTTWGIYRGYALFVGGFSKDLIGLMDLNPFGISEDGRPQHPSYHPKLIIVTGETPVVLAYPKFDKHRFKGQCILLGHTERFGDLPAL